MLCHVSPSETYWPIQARTSREPLRLFLRHDFRVNSRRQVPTVSPRSTTIARKADMSLRKTPTRDDQGRPRQTELGMHMATKVFQDWATPGWHEVLQGGFAHDLGN